MEQITLLPFSSEFCWLWHIREYKLHWIFDRDRYAGQINQSLDNYNKQESSCGLADWAAPSQKELAAIQPAAAVVRKLLKGWLFLFFFLNEWMFIDFPDDITNPRKQDVYFAHNRKCKQKYEHHYMLTSSMVTQHSPSKKNKSSCCQFALPFWTICRYSLCSFSWVS